MILNEVEYVLFIIIWSYIISEWDQILVPKNGVEILMNFEKKLDISWFCFLVDGWIDSFIYSRVRAR
jgi:hypothetical protein